MVWTQEYAIIRDDVALKSIVVVVVDKNTNSIHPNDHSRQTNVNIMMFYMQFILHYFLPNLGGQTIALLTDNIAMY